MDDLSIFYKISRWIQSSIFACLFGNYQAMVEMDFRIERDHAKTEDNKVGKEEVDLRLQFDWPSHIQKWLLT